MSFAAFARSPLLSEALPVWRARFLQVVLLTAFISLAGRAFYLQVIDKTFLQKHGEARFVRVLEVAATRGRILDRDGNALAVSAPVKSIWAEPEEVDLTPPQARDLAKLLGISQRELAAKLDSERGFVYLRRWLEPGIAAQVMALKLPGIYDQTEYRRFYPSGDNMAHLLGFTGDGDNGQEGAELAFNKSLAGEAGSRRVIKDRRGDVVENLALLKEPRPGQDVVLAIDSKLQFLVYSALQQAVIAHRASAGSAVMLDAHSGEVLALVNLPTYNPNNRKGLTGAQLRNRAITDIYEPGSTMKPFIAALALESGGYRPDTKINTAPGKLTIGEYTISDTHVSDVLTLAQVIQKSSNVGISKVMLGFKRQMVADYFAALGFGKVPGTGFPGESNGKVRPVASWQPIEQATMSYGNGIAVTLMQLAQAYTVFANGGVIQPLSLTRVETPKEGHRVFSAKTADEVRAMLELVVGPGGTAMRAQVPGYRVAGKTGTAHKLVKGHYVDKYVASFVGMAPASNPRLVLAIMIDEPAAGKYYGGEVAAPIFSQIMGGALRALGVANDAPLQLPPWQGAIIQDVP